MAPSQYITFFLIGVAAGFMSGMFGIRGGSVRIPLLNLAGLPLLSAFAINLFVIPFSSGVGAFSHRKNINKVIATSLFVTIFTAMAAILIYWQRGNISWLPGLSVLIGSMVGAGIGSKTSLKTKPRWLEIGFSVLVLLLAALTVYKVL